MLNLPTSQRSSSSPSMPTGEASQPPLPFQRETYDYPDPTTQTQKDAFRTKGASKFYDPCATATAKSMKCLEQNNYDKSKCLAAFSAYKECKRTWVMPTIASSAHSR